MTAAKHTPAIVKTSCPTPSEPAGQPWPSCALCWRNEADTQAFAAALAALPALRHAFIELHGELGAGKTTFVRHLLRALGVPGRIKSPSYAVVETYDNASTAGANPPTALPIWHFDFYRFHDPREWEDAGFRDIFASPGLKLVEWPEHARALLPQADLRIHITLQADDSRHLQLHAPSPCGQTLLQAIQARP